MKNVLENVAKLMAVISGFYVIIICLQPVDGGENMGIGGIGGWSAVITAVFVVTVGYLYYRRLSEVDDLKSQIGYYKSKDSKK